MRRLTLLLVAALLSLGLATATPGAARADNGAIAVNTKDGSSIFKFAFAIRRVTGPVVDETNAAVAYASCTSCRTTAIAIEIVLVAGNPTTFTPTNTAIAVNYMCTLCSTFASAYQFVVQGSRPLHFTHQGNRDLHDIRAAIRDLRDGNLSPFELQAQLDPLIARLRQVLATELVPTGGEEDNQNDGNDQSNNGDNVPKHGGDTTTTSTGPAAVATQTTGTDTTPTTTATTPTTTETTTTPTTTPTTTAGDTTASTPTATTTTTAPTTTSTTP